MKNKKTQQEIIVTVLLVLLALAAVVIIAGFIMRNVRTSTETGGAKVDCLSLDYEITQAVNGNANIGIRRNTGGESVNVSSIRILVDGSWTGNMTTGLPAILETKSAKASSSNLATGQKVEIAPVLQGGTVCDVEAQKIVSAA